MELAGSGTVSLLVDTPWATENWFPTRDAAKDYEFTVQMTRDVRRALDALLAQPGIDTSRVAIVGHDFGAMWGALAAAADPRVTQSMGLQIAEATLTGESVPVTKVVNV